jgi:hypothetical protein
MRFAKGSAKWRVVFGALLALSVVLGTAVQAHALPIFIPIQFMRGTAVDAGTTAPIAGIVVSAYDNASGLYEGSAVTGSDGKFAIFLFPGDYKLQYRDPKGKYGETWWYNQANMTDASENTLASNTDTIVDPVQLRQAGTIKTVVRRAGHPLTRCRGCSSSSSRSRR